MHLKFIKRAIINYSHNILMHFLQTEDLIEEKKGKKIACVLCSRIESESVCSTNMRDVL